MRGHNARAMNYAEVFVVDLASIVSAATGFPRSRRHLRRCALRLATRREFVRLARLAQREQKQSEKATKGLEATPEARAAALKAAGTGKAPMPLERMLYNSTRSGDADVSLTQQLIDERRGTGCGAYVKSEASFAMAASFSTTASPVELPMGSATPVALPSSGPSEPSGLVGPDPRMHAVLSTAGAGAGAGSGGGGGGGGGGGVGGGGSGGGSSGGGGGGGDGGSSSPSTGAATAPMAYAAAPPESGGLGCPRRVVISSACPVSLSSTPSQLVADGGGHGTSMAGAGAGAARGAADHDPEQTAGGTGAGFRATGAAAGAARRVIGGGDRHAAALEKLSASVAALVQEQARQAKLIEALVQQQQQQQQRSEEGSGFMSMLRGGAPAAASYTA